MRDGRFVQVDPPAVVYGAPVDPTTAAFVGGGTFVDGIVPDTAGGNTVETELGRLPLSTPANGSVRVLVRPEQVEIAHDAPVKAQVLAVDYHGAQIVVELALRSGAVVHARGPATQPPAAGEEVGIRVLGAVRAYPRNATGAGSGADTGGRAGTGERRSDDHPHPQPGTDHDDPGPLPTRRLRLRPAPAGRRARSRPGRSHVSHAELADLVEQRRAELGPVRRLVVLDGASTVEAVVDHLACLAGGHVAILVAPGAPSTERLIAAYDPDVVVSHRHGRRTDVRRDGSAHELHPELALLLSTSGSSGSPKLVRISTGNLRANAAAIADYLGLDGDDRAAASLPLHYCYGLSVLHSHLFVGGSVWLTDQSVVDDAFWKGFGRRPARRPSPACPTRSTCSSSPASRPGISPGSTGCVGSPRPVAPLLRSGSASGQRADERTASTSS